MNINAGANITVNGRSYRFPKVPTVCVCIDGSEPGYIERAVASGLAPNFARLMKDDAVVVRVGRFERSLAQCPFL